MTSNVDVRLYLASDESLVLATSTFLSLLQKISVNKHHREASDVEASINEGVAPFLHGFKAAQRARDQTVTDR